MQQNDTIAAISSAAGPAIRMIVRVSGPEAWTIASRICPAPLPRRGAIRRRLAFAGMQVPAWIYLFAAPRSYTAEDLVELHIPGNPLLAKMLLQELIGLGARPAEPGEFTARAFFNGRLDLAEAEGVAATIAASNEQELAAARRLMSGELARRVAPAIDSIANTLTLLEVGIDFSEEDVTFLSGAEISSRIAAVDTDLGQLLDESVRFERLSHEPTVVLVGRPNAGKSTLLNALAGHERAVVSPTAGTTRDVLSAEIALPQGVCRLIDVAGLEDPTDDTAAQSRSSASDDVPAPSPLYSGERAGVRGEASGNELGASGPSKMSEQLAVELQMQHQALRAIEQADRVVWVHDVTDSRPPLPLPRQPDVTVISKADLRSAGPLHVGSALRTISMESKMTLPGKSPGNVGASGVEPSLAYDCERTSPLNVDWIPNEMLRGADPTKEHAPADVLHLSAKTGQGLPEFRAVLDRLLFGHTSGAATLALNARHVKAIEEARSALARAETQLPAGPEFVALELREALDALGSICGRISPDDLLGRIFAGFCIGK